MVVFTAKLLNFGKNLFRMRYKAVIFDIGGVLVPQPQIGIRRYEKELNLPPGFLGSVFIEGVPNNSFCKLERGELPFTEFLSEFDADVRAASRRDGVDIGDFSSSVLFRKMVTRPDDVHKEMFHAIKVLHSKNVKTCALTNNWIDERPGNKEKRNGFMTALRRFFDVVIESAHEGIRKPDPKIYQLACDRLGVLPKQAIFLDDIGRNLKTAAEMGITCIKVTSPTKAIVELQQLVGCDLLPTNVTSPVYPPPCKPHDVPHAVATLRSGIKIHYVDVGEGPTVMLFHGFPDCWYSWRYQIPALASAGYRVIAVDQRGFGDSSVPYAIDEYTQQKICQDAIDLMDVLGIGQTAIVGHDWGGQVVWNLALFHPHRVTGVCSVVTPFFTGAGAKNLVKNIETFDYQMYFQTPGVAEKEFEEDMARFFKLIFRGVGDDPLPFPDGKEMVRDTTNVRERGGMFVGFPTDVPIGKLITEDDLAYYVEQYSKTGIRGALNWYRNREAMEKWMSQRADRKIVTPALMITASHDRVLKPEFSLGMEERVPDLTRVALQQCSHWAQIEKPDEVNDAIIKFLDKIHFRKSKL